MVAYGMNVLDVLRAATAINARTFHLDKLGELKAGFLADVIAVKGDPSQQIEDLRNVTFVMKDGVIYKNDNL